VIDVVAHRGLHVFERENTIAAFRAAVALGVDGVELDVRRTSDGVLVVHHDPNVGSIAIAKNEQSALPEYVPTLAQALESVDGVSVNVEIKNDRGPSDDYGETAGLVRQVLDTIDGSPWLDGSSVSSFDLATCTYVRSMDRNVSVAWLLWDVVIGDALVQAHLLGFNAVNPHFSTVDDEVVARARDLQLDVNVWTVNSEEDLERAAALGVACIITDDPVLARAVVTRATPTSTGR
jgi:glycerophosphoryl diester phosphodiesterase